jgi:hypothetical protein
MATQVTFECSWKEAGLISYKICVDTRLRQLAPSKVAKATEAAAALLLVGIMAASGVWPRFLFRDHVGSTNRCL